MCVCACPPPRSGLMYHWFLTSFFVGTAHLALTLLVAAAAVAGVVYMRMSGPAPEQDTAVRLQSSAVAALNPVRACVCVCGRVCVRSCGCVL